MKSILSITGAVFVAMIFALSSCAVQDEMPAKPAAPAPPAKAPAAPPAKAKVEKAGGDIGLLDTEKNYLILVTKEGKLVTLDFDSKTTVTQITPTPGKMADIGLGSSATVTYEIVKDKNIATKLDYRPAKGGD
ncbi:MAG: hypothetical protein HYW03_04010 [Deltaproteobacteria bacterium]|nr:hypothetical protein [Deltaproteobacteria bacterium]